MNKSNCTYKHINLFRKLSNLAAIDVLDYSYDGNQLTQVDDAGTNEGFKDGDNTGIDYEYDANGNMYIDRNKEIEDIDYNFLNLPKVITFKPKDGVTRKIEYIYDAAGIKLGQRVYEDATQATTKTTDYIGGRVYETTVDDPIELQFIHHEEGRIVEDTDPNSTEEWDYQYYLKDHLGNTRLTFGEEKTEEYILTMEVETPANRLIEDEEFENVNITEDNKLPDLNHTPVTSETPSPEYSVFLDGTTRIIGPGKSLKVLPGDEVEMSVHAKYLHVDGGYDPSVAGDMLLSGFSGAFVDVGGEMLKAKGYVDEGLLTSLENIANGGADYEGVPQAYLNYILFDKDYNVIEGKKLQISEAGKFTIGNETVGDHEHLQIDPITISEEGYVYIYLSNQTPNSEVYFDDMYIKHTQSRVVQKEDYYPFGLSIAELSTTRENIVGQNWKFQGQEHQTDFGLNWYAFKWRNHQPDIGRFFNVDPLAEDYVYNSPYAFSENQVTSHIELEGLEKFPANEAWNRFTQGLQDAWDDTGGKALEATQEFLDEAGNTISKIANYEFPGGADIYTVDKNPSINTDPATVKGTSRESYTDEGLPGPGMPSKDPKDIIDQAQNAANAAEYISNTMNDLLESNDNSEASNNSSNSNVKRENDNESATSSQNAPNETDTVWVDIQRQDGSGNWVTIDSTILKTDN